MTHNAVNSPPLPDFVQIEPVGQCNLRCRMCAIQFRPDGPPHGPPALMPLELFQRLIDDFGAVRELHLQGLGEPFMHPQFFEMVEYAVAKGIQVSTNTNLTLMTPQRAQRCVSSGLHYLHVSLDGASAETFEAIRLGAAFHKVVRNLGRIMQARAQANSQTPHVRIVVVAMRRNLQELPALVEIAHQHGVSALFVQHLSHDFQESSLPAEYLPMREFVTEQTLFGEDPQRVAHFFELARARAEALGVQLRLPPVGRPPIAKSRQCDWPWRGAYLSYGGDAMPCCMVSTPDRVNFGNMGRDGVKQTWSNEAYQNFRDQLASDTPPEICQSCSLYRGEF
jgi:radical SAM protein with 4Fe4S-binding SPASM domain